MKLFSYTYCDEEQYGINVGVVFADTREEAIILIAIHDGIIEPTEDQINYIRDNYNFMEIPILKGVTYIDGYSE